MLMSRTKLRCSFYGLWFKHQLFSKLLRPSSDLPSYSAPRWPVGGLGSTVCLSSVLKVHSVLFKVRFMHTQLRVRFMCTQHTEWAGSKLGKEYVKAVYCHSVYLTYLQSTSCEMLAGRSTSWNQDCWEKYQYADTTTLMAESEEELKSL